MILKLVVMRSYAWVLPVAALGCATSLSDRASRIRWADHAQQTEGCKFLGIVQGGSKQTGVANISTGRNNARNEALERAAEKGATHVHWLSNDESFSGIHITAEAFKCSSRKTVAASSNEDAEMPPAKKKPRRISEDDEDHQEKENDESEDSEETKATEESEESEETKATKAAHPSKDARANAASLSMGTCFFVSHSGLALTSLHVVKDAKNVLILDARGNRTSATVLAKDDRLDLAALQVDQDKVPSALALSDKEARLGDHVFTIGFPEVADLGSDPKFTEGVVSGEKGLGLDFLLQTSTPVQPGNSGGPLINHAGEVIGIVALRQNYFSDGAAATNTAFAIKATNIKRAFRSLSMDPAKPTKDRKAAIERAKDSVCLVVARDGESKPRP